MTTTRTTETLWLILTRRCTLACRYCFEGSEHGRRSGLEDFVSAEILERARTWATGWTHQELQVVLYGGEPLLAWPLIREHLPGWGAAFAQAGKAVRFSCTTNGTLLRRRVREWFDEHKIGLLLSLDGPPHIHDRMRVYRDGSPSWRMIRPEELLAWRPNLEIAWCLTPALVPERQDLDWMLDRGFRAINFNLEWFAPWPLEARSRLERFMRHVFLRSQNAGLRSNWVGKLERALTVDARIEEPCGSGRHSLALTPEGWLYPSQEMAFAVLERGRAPGTAEHYRVGDVSREPVLNATRLADVGRIRLEQMRPPAGYDCEACIARSISIGGCHCRFVGQDGVDPAERYDTPASYCDSMTAALSGLLQGAAIARHVRPVGWLAEKAAAAIRGTETRPRRGTSPATLAGWGR